MTRPCDSCATRPGAREQTAIGPGLLRSRRAAHRPGASRDRSRAAGPRTPVRSRPRPAHAAAHSSPTMSWTSSSTSAGGHDGPRTGQLGQHLRIEPRDVTAAAGPASPRALDHELPEPGVPKVSATRCTRSWSVGLTTEWRRQLSNSHASPAAMCTVSSPQLKLTSGHVITGMCRRTR